MDQVIEIIKISLPASIVLYATYLLTRSFLQKELESIRLESKVKTNETILPLRLQAYERICLFLERSSPNNLIIRLNDQKMTAKEFQQRLLSEVREEFNHNLAQQVYIGDEAWDLAKGAIEQLNAVINEAGSEVNEQASSLDLAKLIFQKVVQWEKDPIQTALLFVKKEIRDLF